MAIICPNCKSTRIGLRGRLVQKRMYDAKAKKVVFVKRRTRNDGYKCRQCKWVSEK